MNAIFSAWEWFTGLGLKTPKELALRDLLEAQRELLEWEKRREEAVSAVALLRARIHRLQSSDEALL